MKLAEFQKTFSSALLQSDDSMECSDLINGQLSTSSGCLDPKKGFSIYKQGFRARQSSVLQDFFACTRQLVGKDNFAYVADQYSRANVAQLQDLNLFGETFPNFIGSMIPEIPYIRDIAVLDWRWHRVFYEKDEPAISTSAIQSIVEIDPDNLVLVPPVSLRLVPSHFPLLSIWNFCQAKTTALEDEDEDESEIDISIDIDGCHSTCVAVWRLGLDRYIAQIPTQTENFLRAAQKNMTFGETVSRYFSDCDEKSIAFILSTAFSKGWIINTIERDAFDQKS